jgi:molybdate/tungstate transport system ATP-binding protein
VSASIGAEVLAVLGPSGSGKSTLLSVVAGFHAPDAGTVRLDGRDITERPPEERDVGVVFQDYALFPHLTARENVAFGTDHGEGVDEYTELLDVSALLDRYPETLSGGQKQRVALARALAADPDALLLDEPLAGLDEPIRRRLRIDLRHLLTGLDIPVIYVTHDQGEAAAVADRLAVLDDGTVAQTGTVESVYDTPANRFVARFVGYDNLVDGTITDRQSDGVLVDAGGDTFSIATERSLTGAITVAARPEHVSVHPQDGHANGVRCTVTELIDGRDETTVLLSTDEGERLVATAEDVRFDTGTAVLARIDPHRARLLPES